MMGSGKLEPHTVLRPAGSTTPFPFRATGGAAHSTQHDKVLLQEQQ